MATIATVPTGPAIFLLGAALAAPQPASGDGGPGRVVEEVVAVVRPPASSQTRVVTLTRLAEEARIALVSRGATEAAFAPLDGPALRAGLDWVVDQIILGDEAARLGVFEVDRSEGLAELRRFRSRFEDPARYQAFLEKLDLAEEELLAVLRRMLRVQRYLDSRVSRAARVPDADVEAFYREHAEQLGGRPLADVREAVRAHLAGKRAEAQVQSFVADLRARAEVRVLSLPEEPVR